MPLATEPLLSGQNTILNRAGFHWLYIIGRLKPGVRAGMPSSRRLRPIAAMAQPFNPTSRRQDRAKIGKQQILITPAGGGVAALANETPRDCGCS